MLILEVNQRPVRKGQKIASDKSVFLNREVSPQQVNDVTGKLV